MGGSYETGQIDVDDIANIEKNGKMESFSSAAAMIHEVIEQKAKQIDKLPYLLGAHQAGINAEDKVTGWSRRMFEDAGTYVGSPAGGVTGGVEFTYQKGAEVRKVTLSVMNSNIQNASERKPIKIGSRYY